MLDLIRSINIETAGYLSVTIISLVIISHGLIILKIIPYNWINGGRSESYEAQKKQSILGMLVLFITIPFLLIASNIVIIDLGSMADKIINIILWISVILLTISTIMQLLGTRFERYVMSITVFVLLVCVLRMTI
ncbi:MAG: hypothetical protein RSG52_02565 [Terrisporobacter sp.]|uniref:hypothetical protein n=1 Tax=Terrisporobacter sp. TaxID=1965305 RepID=UPI002FC76B11